MRRTCACRFLLVLGFNARYQDIETLSTLEVLAMNRQPFKPFCFTAGLTGMLILLSGQFANAEPSLVSEEQPDRLETSEPAFDTALETALVPVPGTVATSASSLQPAPLMAQTSPTTPPADSGTTAPTTTPTITPGRATRSGPSYIAVGGNIGFGGSTALGRGNFVITSKIGLTNYFSARPGLVVGRSPTILLPVTVDFPVQSAIDGRVSVAPFVGGGLAVSTRGSAAVRALVTGGIDVPLSDRFTATASANVAFFNRPEIGVILGVGYNF